MKHNHAAGVGGALYATNSKVYVNGHMTIANNTASVSGGGVYLYQSEVNCEPDMQKYFSGMIQLLMEQPV